MLRSWSVCQTLVCSWCSRSSCSEPRRLVGELPLGDPLKPFSPVSPVSRVPFPGICHAIPMRLCSSDDDMSLAVFRFVFRISFVVVILLFLTDTPSMLRRGRKTTHLSQGKGNSKRAASRCDVIHRYMYLPSLSFLSYIDVWRGY